MGFPALWIQVGSWPQGGKEGPVLLLLLLLLLGILTACES